MMNADNDQKDHAMRHPADERMKQPKRANIKKDVSGK